ncbi:hypothetical protein [Rahnella laticis]|uniref:hypothetical protein n=1 Tax=Rahnella laticis TaxID=2787622 RepID=UPI0018A290FF|nr:hypothetical protein [Rahnella laticis]MBF7997512.1 hypothetical protein [Rahnella laticis]
MEIKIHEILLYGLFLSVIYSESVFSDDNIFPIGQYNFNIAERPSVPYPALMNYNTNLTEQGSGPTYSVTVSRHHIIPFNVLRSFYNTVGERDRLRAMGGFFNIYANNLHNFASSNGVDCNSLGNDLIDAANLAMALGYGTARAGGERTLSSFETFEQFYTWLPGNLFIGPNNRSDDPSDGFETGAAVVVGTSNFIILNRLYMNMLDYIRNGDNSLLNSITSDLNRVAARKRVYQLDPQNWLYVNGKYKLNTGTKSRTEIPTHKTYSDSNSCDAMTPTFQKYLLALSQISARVYHY